MGFSALAVVLCRMFLTLSMLMSSYEVVMKGVNEVYSSRREQPREEQQHIFIWRTTSMLDMTW
jgi:hypothetical protein